MLRRRADVRFAEYALQAETARVGVATADLFPRVSLLGSVGYVSTSASELGNGDTRTTSFGPFLSWAAFDLGRVRANIRVANADMDAALLRYEQTVLIALEETENALFGFTSARTRQARLEAARQVGAYSLNNLTAKPNPDGSFTVRFGGCDKDAANCLPIMPGWNYTVRLYRPRQPILDGTWKFPEATPVK